jgi:restriction endonuclease S subunit
LVDESKEAIDPQSLSDGVINYIGLENIRSHTGEIVDFDKKSPREVKSRSKTFKEGDVLFGRLRPELNKVYLAVASVAPGICSNEFIILRAKVDRIRPRYLRYILASPYVTQFASKLRTGASLPRLNSADLLDLPVPVPPLDIQDEIVAGLHRLDDELRDLRRRIESLPNAIIEGLMTSLARGTNELEMIESGLR